MTGLEIIGLIGGIASMISIPLGFFFNRKNELQKYENAKRKIIETLMHQIGSGQKIDILGMRLIIDSKLREAGLRAGRISIQEIIADIFTNVTTNPLIEATQKSIYQDQIKRLGLSNTIDDTINKIRERKLLSSGEKVSDEIVTRLEHLDDMQKVKFLKENRLLELKNQDTYISNVKDQLRIYPLLSSLLSGIAALISIFIYSDFIDRFRNLVSPTLLYILISVLVGILITLFVSLYAKARSKKNRNLDNLSEYINLSDNEKEY